MYSTSTSSSTMSRSRGAGAAAARGVRVVRLKRARKGAPPFGFSLRGGREHDAGFFVTKIEHSSEAHRQGLKAGDQVVSVNGYRVDDAVHAELTHYIANQTRLKLKVRNVGMIPVKDKSHEALTWKFVSDDVSLASVTTASSSPTLCDTERLQEVRLTLLVPHKAKLGCGICKGPAWKPGVFVQFVREGGPARAAGLRPGDQLLSCNGVSFSQLHFQEAIGVMKRSSRLELTVRPRGGAELVSPESSGYNSSASTHSEHSPHDRLASVQEEPAERLAASRLKRRGWDTLDGPLSHSFDAPSDIEPDYDSPALPDNPHTFENQRYVENRRSFDNQRYIENQSSLTLKREFTTLPSNKTVINLTENGAMIQCSYEKKERDINRKTEKKTIVVEVHERGGGGGGVAGAVARETGSDSGSLTSDTTLASAIAEEILRRKLKKSSDASPAPAPPPPKKPLKPVDCEKQRQHDALMDEFKKVHRKMFCAQDAEETVAADRQPTLPLRRTAEPARASADGDVKPLAVKMTPPPPPPMPSDENTRKDTPETKYIAPKSNGIVPTNRTVADNLVVNGKNCEVNSVNIKPLSNGIHTVKKTLNFPNGISNGIMNGKPKANEISIGKANTNGALKRTPTPDYETNNIETLTAKLKLKTFAQETAEVDSIESYKMKNPASTQPKPPSNYFMRPPNGTATMKKTGRPVSITIGEYPSRTLRKEPSKLGFLNGDEKLNGETDKDEQVPIGSRLQSELAMTLSRSNLRKKTEVPPKLDNNGNVAVDNIADIDQAPDTNFHKRYGNNILPTPPPIAIPKVPVVKTNSHPISKHIAMLAGKVSNMNKHDESSEGVKNITFEQTMTANGEHLSIAK